MAAPFGGLSVCGSAILHSPGRGHRSALREHAGQARDHVGRRLDRHEGQRRVQRRIDLGDVGLGAACGGADQQGHFALGRAGLVIMRRQFAPSVPRRTSSCSLVSSRATAALRGRPAPPPSPPGVSASRWAGFKKDQGGADGFQFFQRALALARLGRTESPRTGSGRTAGPPAPARSAPPRRPARHDRQCPRCDRLAHQLEAGIGHQRRAGIADQRDRARPSRSRASSRGRSRAALWSL